MDSTAIDTAATAMDTAYNAVDSLYIAMTNLQGSIDTACGFGWTFLGFFATLTCGLYLLKSNFRGN